MSMLNQHIAEVKHRLKSVIESCCVIKSVFSDSQNYALVLSKLQLQ